jgi:hypothetical protein
MGPEVAVAAGRRYYCTLFDSNYLLKGVVMLESLLQHAPGAIVYVLCMDEPTIELLATLRLDVRLLRLVDVEDQSLRAARSTRSTAEYCWTLSSALCWYLMERRSDAEWVTYLDADLMFFSSVEPLFGEVGPASIVITEHRYPPRLAHLEAVGRFNVQWVGFRPTVTGNACLQRWRSQCIEWCYATADEGRLGDQKYLDEWPELYGPEVHVVSHPGVGAAPWNVFGSRLERRGDAVLVDGAPLIFYHFHQFQLLTNGRFDYMSTVYSQGAPAPAIVYDPYVAAVSEVLARVRRIDRGFAAGMRSAAMVSARRFVQRFAPARLKDLLRPVFMGR